MAEINCKVLEVRDRKSEYGKFVIIKLESDGINDILGKSRGRIYYALRQETTLKPNQSLKLELDNFNIIEREWVSDDGEEMKLKYLLPK